MIATEMPAEEFRHIRENLGLSQRGLAIVLGAKDERGNQRSVERYELGASPVPAAVAIVMRLASRSAGCRALLSIPEIRKRYPAGRQGRPPKEGEGEAKTTPRPA